MQPKTKILAVGLMLASTTVSANDRQVVDTPHFSLAGTPFEQAATHHGIDPTLLYALTLIESNDTNEKRGIQAGYIAPWPYTLRTAQHAYRFDSREEASLKLTELLKTTRVIDIGWGQINWRWHYDRIDDPQALLDPLTNLEYASEYLAESMALAPDDPALGIGFYHNRGDLPRARNYGERVLAVMNNLNELTEY